MTTGEDDELTSAYADTPDEAETAYFVRPDFRRCASPMCGGVWIARVNRTKTTCVDGSRAEECYVAELDVSELGLSEMQDDALRTAIGARSAIVAGTLDTSSTYGALRATAAWRGIGDETAEGVFVHVRDSGMRCLTTPCPSLIETRVNSSVSANIAHLDFAPSGATDEQIAAAMATVTPDDGIIVAGDRVGRGNNKGRTVTRFFVPLRSEPAPPACYVGGCSLQVCSDRPDIVTTCDWREEYACYRDATCEAQADGTCGWTMTAELAVCLDQAGQ